MAAFADVANRDIHNYLIYNCFPGEASDRLQARQRNDICVKMLIFC